MRRKNIPPNAVEALNPSFERLAQAYHCGYSCPSRAEDFSSALASAFSAGRPTLIEIKVDVARTWFG